MNELVQRLTTDQPVVASLRPEATAEALKTAIDRGYVHLLFTGTSGGTELGVRLDPKLLDLSAADFAHRTGSVKLSGELILDYTRVRCDATIDLATLRGTGHLVPLGDVEPGSTDASASGT